MSINAVLQHKLGLSERVNPFGYGYMRRVAALRLLRPACWFQRHSHWARETMLLALSSGRSKRCKRCNRLVLKHQYRRTA